MDKLNFALESSSHFMIVLSPISVKSDWVKYELENALKFVEQETLEKIIPILYRPCEIPTPLKNLLHADLSKEIVYLRHGTLEFLDDNYYIKLKILVRSVQQVKSQLQSTDKDEIIGKNSLKYKDTAELIELQYKIIGYKSISNFLANQIPPKLEMHITKRSYQNLMRSFYQGKWKSILEHIILETLLNLLTNWEMKSKVILLDLVLKIIGLFYQEKSGNHCRLIELECIKS